MTEKILKKGAAVMLSAIMGASALSGCSDNAPGTDAPQNIPENTSEAAVEVKPTGWSYGQAAAGGGGFVTGVFSTCENGVFYARTDVGGAYRWNDSAKRWTSLSYWVSEADVGLLGISALAADPNNAAKLWLLAGTEYFSGGKTCVLISDDYGENFRVVDISDMIRVHGNCMGRGNGERIAVDPNNADILLAGGNTGGIIKSFDGGLSWEAVSFPVNATSNGNGVNIILFDPSSVKDGASQRVYACASQTGDNLFVSEDGGSSWSTVDIGYDGMPQRIKMDSRGRLYIVMCDKEGPWNQSKGAVLRYDPSSGSAENIEPEGLPFGDIVIDPDNEEHMVLVTTQTWQQQPNGAYGDKFFVSTDGGKSWTDTRENMKLSANGMPWIEKYAIHWCSSLALDPFNTGRIMVTSGNGIFACDNIWDSEPQFYFNSLGLEETVPMDLISLEGYPLVSAVMDYDGYVHEDIFTPAKTHGDDGIGGVTSITIAPQNRDMWAKIGSNEERTMLEYTTDGGKTWSAKVMSPEKGKNFYGGKLAFNADGTRLVWSPANSFGAYMTADMGRSWTKCTGVTKQAIYLLGDSTDPNYFYAYKDGNLYVSSDGGESFEIKQFDSLAKGDRLCVSPDGGGTFLLPAGGAGLYKTTDYGENFTKYDKVLLCRVVSLGKPKSEGAPYAIYIYGTTVDDPDDYAIYMSADDGETWERVTDDRHRFGGLGNGSWICGDMNVFGRCYTSSVGLGICYCDRIEK